MRARLSPPSGDGGALRRFAAPLTDAAAGRSWRLTGAAAPTTSTSPSPPTVGAISAANQPGPSQPPPAARRAVRALTGLIERALRDWLADVATREQTQTLIVESILAVARHVLPAVMAAEAERP
jgi:hypothetical protein